MDPRLDPSLAAVDQRVRRAVDAHLAWRERLEAAPFVDGPIEPPLAEHRAVAGKRALEELRARDVPSASAEWRDALRRWIAVLTVERVTAEQWADQVRAETSPSAHVRRARDGGDQVVSFREAWRGFLHAEGIADAGPWLEALTELGPSVAAARREYLAREAEALHQLGVGGFLELVDAGPSDAIGEAARAFLTRTHDLARSLQHDAVAAWGEPSFAGTVLAARARQTREGWPAQLTLRSLVETFGAPSDIGRGLRVRARLPEALGGASFARGLVVFGEAYRKAAASASRLPFAIAVDPYFVDAHRFGYAFGSLPTSPSYQQRGLGVVARIATDQARAMTLTAFQHARTLAMAVALAAPGARRDATRFEELSVEVFAAPEPRALAGAFPRARGDEPARLSALLTTLPFLLHVRERFDDDWFRNPRAWEYLRARASGPARTPAEDAIDPRGLAIAFEKALG